MPISNNNDPLGVCLLDYENGVEDAQILTWSDVEGWDYLPASRLFRGWRQMPEVEQIALSHCKGKVLDVGAGAGSHALWLDENGHETLAIDVSRGAVEVMKRRGVNAKFADFFKLANEEKYDTLLLMMNGIGMCGDMPGFYRFLDKAESLLGAEGQILFDSADIIYLFTEEADGQYVDLSRNYYGEVNYRMKYKNHTTEEFGWLFIDFDTLRMWCTQRGWQVEMLYEGNNYEYLAQLTKG
jgi:SAM-dependent methyltransferase